MAKLMLYMSMSLDGFISVPDDETDNPFGTGGERLHDWLRPDGPEVAAHRPSAGPSQVVFDDLMATGAVVSGRRTFELAGRWGGDHHDGVPIHVLTVPVPLGAGRRLFDAGNPTTSSCSSSGDSKAATRHTCVTGSSGQRRGSLTTDATSRDYLRGRLHDNRSR